MKQLALIALIVVAIAQWAVPGKIIRDKETILQNGKIFRFRTEPVDPFSPFKGKYIALQFRENQFLTLASKTTLEGGDEAFVILQKDAEGFATVAAVMEKPPAGAGIDFVKAQVRYISPKGNDSTTIWLDYPFSEFYMDEFKAPKAETVYRESNIDTTQKTYALVSILNGNAVIKDVMINEKPIRQVIKEQPGR